ncbi:unnamed protein product [Prunus armeniaca]
MEEASALASGWACLPSDLLDSMLEKLVPVSDYIVFSAVCKHWRSIALHNRKKRLESCHRQLPMLMVPSKDKNDEMRGLYSVTQGKTCTFELHVPYNKRCCGSSHRLLAYADDKSVITLLNPFTGCAIRLPQVTKVPRLFIRPEGTLGRLYCLLTLICFQMIMKLWLLYLDFGPYPVESSRGELLLIMKFEGYDFHLRMTVSFKVFKLLCAGGDRPEFVEEIESIGSDALFLGEVESMRVSALDFLGCQPNCIYFSTSYWGIAEGPLDMAAFNLAPRRMETHYFSSSRSTKRMPSSVWILPTVVLKPRS